MAMVRLADVIYQVRQVLMDVAPLKIDCGLLCGAACCQSLPGEQTGMLLFPGEESYCAGVEGFTLTPASAGELLTCQGTCDRRTRPIACGIFPLLPVVYPDGIRVEVDRRSRAVCPLTNESVHAFDFQFVKAVQLAGNLLMEHPDTAHFLQQLSEGQQTLKQLQLQLGGKPGNNLRGK